MIVDKRPGCIMLLWSQRLISMTWILPSSPNSQKQLIKTLMATEFCNAKFVLILEFILDGQRVNAFKCSLNRVREAVHWKRLGWLCEDVILICKSVTAHMANMTNEKVGSLYDIYYIFLVPSYCYLFGDCTWYIQEVVEHRWCCWCKGAWVNPITWCHVSLGKYFWTHSPMWLVLQSLWYQHGQIAE